MEDKAKVYNYWLHEFPELKAVNKNKFGRVIGPVVVSIELLASNFSSVYSPYIVINTLWEEDIKKCLYIDVIMDTIRGTHPLKYDIDDSELPEAITHSRVELQKLLCSIVCTENLYKLIDNMTLPNSILHIFFSYELKLYLALCINNISIINLLLEEIRSKDWKVEYIENVIQKSIGEWIDNWQDIIANREVFMEKVNKNRIDKRLKNLEFSELVN